MDLTPEEILQQLDHTKKNAEKRAGIDSEKVQKTVSSYLQIARDNRLNYSELLQVFTLVKEQELQLLNKAVISDMPDTTSDAAKQ